jgi:hypothetical protein
LSATGSMPQLRSGDAFSAIAILIALVLAWRVVSNGLSALQAGDVPAFGVRPPESFAPAAPEATWRTQLSKYPVDYKALVMLAPELERQGRIADARAAMDEALLLAPGDQRTLLEASAFYLRAGDVSKALLVMRRTAEFYPDVRESLWPVFTAALDGSRHDDFFADVARANPDWWAEFFRYACQKSADVDALQRVFAARTAAGVLDADERRCLIGRLQHENRWTDAYQIWLNSLPPEQRQRVGYIFNGSFEWPLSDVGFDWRIPAQDGIDVRVLPIDDVSGRQVLKVEFVNKLWEAPPIQQHLMLFPGRYRFEGRGRVDGLQTWLGLQWGLYCVPVNGSRVVQLTHSGRFVGSSGWEPFGSDFNVPDSCPVQLLRLELVNPRGAAEMDDHVTVRLRGSIWFSDLRVRSLD